VKGLDLPSLVKQRRLVYVNGLSTVGSDGDSAASLPKTSLEALSLVALSKAIDNALKAAGYTPNSDGGRTQAALIVVDGLDFILASQPEIDAVHLQQLLSKLLTSTQSLIVSCHADTPLLHNRHESSTPLEREHGTFITAMAHQARLVLQLRGLDTGSARDVTGIMRISPGGQQDDEGDTPTLTEGEWLYQCKSDGSVKVWSRGE
jgi:elongator complex protein 6